MTMKILPLAFVIFTISNIGTFSSGQTLDSEATILLGKVNELIPKVNNVLKSAETIRFSVPNKVQSMDFGIPQDPQIVEINNLLKQDALKRGIEECIKMKDNTIAALKAEFSTSFTTESYKRIDAILASLKDAQLKLQRMDNYLRGSNLDVIITNCNSKPQECEITHLYPTVINEISATITRSEPQLPNILNQVLESTIKPNVHSKIVKNIYQPVQQCIKLKAI